MVEVPNSYYLAHPKSSRKEIREWELGFEKRTGIILLNPFYDVSRPDIEDIDNGVPNPRRKDAVSVVEDDVKLLRSQPRFLCILDGSSTTGTYQEMIYAFFDEKPIYSIVTEEKMRNHPWIKYHSTKIFESLDEFEKFVTSDLEKID